MKRYRPVIFISFYMIILIIIAAQLWGANGFLHPAIENINLYVRGLRNTLLLSFIKAMIITCNCYRVFS